MKKNIFVEMLKGESVHSLRSLTPSAASHNYKQEEALAMTILAQTQLTAVFFNSEFET